MPTRGAVAVAERVKGGIQICASYLCLFTWKLLSYSSFFFRPDCGGNLDFFFQTGIVHSAARVACASRHSGGPIGAPVGPFNTIVVSPR